MISFKNMVIAGTLAAALALSGCSSTRPAEQAASDSKQKPVITESKPLSIAQGAQNIACLPWFFNW